MSRGATLVLLAVLVTASFAGAVGKPTLAVDDAWVYSAPAAAGSTRFIYANVTSADGGNVVVTRTDRTHTPGTSALPGLPGTPAQTSVVTDVITHNADLAVTKWQHTPAQSGSFATNSGASTTTYDPPCAFLKFPLTVGAKWSADCKGNSQPDTLGVAPTPVAFKYDFEVAAHENVTPTNSTTTFATYKIVNMTGGKAGDVQWYAPAACAVVKAADAAGKTTMELVSFSCASPVADDYVPPAPPEDEAPPANDTGDMGDTGGDTGMDNTTDDMDGEDDTPVDTTPAPPADEKKGLFGLPAPGAIVLVTLLGAAALVWKRR